MGRILRGIIFCIVLSLASVSFAMTRIGIILEGDEALVKDPDKSLKIEQRIKENFPTEQYEILPVSTLQASTEQYCSEKGKLADDLAQDDLINLGKNNNCDFTIYIMIKEETLEKPGVGFSLFKISKAVAVNYFVDIFAYNTSLSKLTYKRNFIANDSTEKYNLLGKTRKNVKGNSEDKAFECLLEELNLSPQKIIYY